MLIHGVAFGFYMLACLLVSIALVYLTVTNKGKAFFHFAGLFDVLANFVSQCMLIIIFW